MTENLYTPNCIRTYTGKYFDPFNPDPDLICIEDICQGLIHTARFKGQTEHFYSVAEHSFIVSYGCLPKNALCGLLHDASEAYLGDIPSPIKNRLPDYKALERNLMRAIAYKFKFAWPMPEDVAYDDKRELESDWKWYVLSNRQWPMQKDKIKTLFMDRFNELTT